MEPKFKIALFRAWAKNSYKNTDLKFEDDQKYIDLCNEVVDEVCGPCDDDEEALSKLKQIREIGCVSGCVMGLIYYTDTIPFYDKHIQIIEAMVNNLMEIYDRPISELFVDWDNEDPLVLHCNKNLLAWKMFEFIVEEFLIYWENIEVKASEKQQKLVV